MPFLLQFVYGLSGATRLDALPKYPLSHADLQGFISRVRNAGAPSSGAHALAVPWFTLPTHSFIRDADVERLTQWIRFA